MEPDYESKPYKVSIAMSLLLIFFVLKITNTGIIGTWAWIWIFSPLWVSYSLSYLLEIILKIVNRWKN